MMSMLDQIAQIVAATGADPLLPQPRGLLHLPAEIKRPAHQQLRKLDSIRACGDQIPETRSNGQIFIAEEDDGQHCGV